MLDHLASGDSSIAELLHGRARSRSAAELAEQLAPGGALPRSVLAPPRDARAAAARAGDTACARRPAITRSPPVTPACSAAVWSRRTGRPLMITEHGIYSREREMELARAEWIEDQRPGAAEDARRAPGRRRCRRCARVWSRFFRTLSRLAYEQAGRIVTLSEVNRRKQLDDGAPAGQDRDRPNGVTLPDGPRRRRRATTDGDAYATRWRRRRDSAAGAPAPAARRLRGARRADQGRHHVRQGVRSGAALGRARRAHHRPRRTRTPTTPRAAARWSSGSAAGADPLRRAEAAGGDLPRPGRRRADQLQRGAAAGDARRPTPAACR